MEYSIGSINMKRMGLTAITKRDFEKIAKMIVDEKLDVVALKEIFSEGKALKRLLEKLKYYVQHELYDWDVCFPDPKETVNFKPTGETYAYIWNKKKFKLIEFTKLGSKRTFTPGIIKKDDARVDPSVFVRPPFYIRLQPINGGFGELRLLNIHIIHGEGSTEINKREAEFEYLVKNVYPGISSRRYGSNRASYTIAMGDYNLNIMSSNVMVEAKTAQIKPNYFIEEDNINIVTIQDQLTTLKESNGYANNYDHFTYSPERSKFQNVSCRTIDAVQKYCGGDFNEYREKISDHLPIVITIQI